MHEGGNESVTPMLEKTNYTERRTLSVLLWELKTTDKMKKYNTLDDNSTVSKQVRIGGRGLRQKIGRKQPGYM